MPTYDASIYSALVAEHEGIHPERVLASIELPETPHLGITFWTLSHLEWHPAALYNESLS